MGNIQVIFLFLKKNVLQYAFLWFSSLGLIKITDEAWRAVTSKYGSCFSFWMQSLLLKELFKI